MLTRVTIKGYRSIRSLEDFELRPVNVLIGANGSGKSNLVGALELMGRVYGTQHSQPGVATVEEFDAWRRSQGGVDDFISTGMAGIDLGGVFSRATGQPPVQARLRLEVDGLQLRCVDEAARLDSGEWIRLSGARGVSALPEEHLTRLARGDDFGAALGWVWQMMQARKLHVADTSLRAKARQECAADDGAVLASDASNLAAYLHRLRRQAPQHADLIDEHLRMCFSGFDALVTEQSGAYVSLRWRDRHSGRLVPMSQTADGMLRIIAVVAFLLGAEVDKRASILALDEPELGVHPQAMGVIASLIHRASETRQVFVATHSPRLLDHFEAEDVIVSSRGEAGSEYRRLTNAEYQGWVDGLEENVPLSSLWIRNYIGGGVW